MTNADLEVDDRPDGTRILTLNRPRRANALSTELVDSLHGALDVADTGGVRALLLRGQGRHFCGGIDLSDIDDETDATLLYRFARIGLLLERIDHAPYLTVARVTGAAVGAGADLVMACTHRLGTPDASLRFPGGAFDVVLGTHRLSRTAGGDTAARLATTGETVTAEQALEQALLTELTTANLIDERIEEVLRAARHMPATALTSVLRVTHGNDADAALSALVRSAAQPGIRDRMLAYASPTESFRVGP